MNQHGSVTGFCVSLYIYLYQRALYFCVLFCCRLASFCFNLKDSLQQFLQGTYSGNKLPQLLFIWKSLYYFFFEEPFYRYSILGWQIFLQHFNISSHSLLAYNISVMKSANNPMSAHLYIMNHFSFAGFEILSLSLTFQFDYVLSMGLFVSILVVVF